MSDCPLFHRHSRPLWRKRPSNCGKFLPHPKNSPPRMWLSRFAYKKDGQLYPDTACQEIREPLFIVGLPRSGTTLLHILLAADPQHRAPLTWEVMTPSPPTNQNERQRIRRAARNLSSLRWLAPMFEN